jgi:mono/diheme cytochrome c family protein
VIVGLALIGASDGRLTAFAPGGPDQPERAQTTSVDGVYTRVQAQRGAAEYGKACASCHLEDLSGQHTSPALAGETFVLRFDGQSLAELFERVKTTMPQGAVGSLSDQAYADVLAYILQANRYRPGAQELAPDLERLRNIIVKRPLER